MDNDDLRRGKPTCHKVFGEAIAILAGDALLTEAFRLLCDRERIPDVAPERTLRVVREIAEAAGFSGMVGGQVKDLLAEGEKVDLQTLCAIHRLKTGASDSGLPPGRGDPRRGRGGVARPAFGLRPADRPRLSDRRRHPERGGRPGPARQGGRHRRPAQQDLLSRAPRACKNPRNSLRIWCSRP